MHTIIIRPRADFEPRVEGIVNHTVVIEDGVEIVQESLIYIRALRDALTVRIDAAEAAERGPELKHPGTWLPGDQIEDFQGDIWTRREDGTWDWYLSTGQLGGRAVFDDADATGQIVYSPSETRITHLVPRSEVA